MWRTRRRTTKPSAGQAPAAERARIPRSVLWRCWKTAPTFCGRREVDQYATDEITLAEDGRARPPERMLCLADRFFPGYELWRKAAQPRARICCGGPPECASGDRTAPAGRILSQPHLSVHFGSAERRKAIVVRVIEYRLEGGPRGRADVPLDHHHPGPQLAPAKELAALYHERWEIETLWTS